MEQTERDLSDYLYNRFGGKKPAYKMNSIEKKYFKTLNDNMMKNSQKRIDGIKTRIMSDVAKNNFGSKYQIKSLYEYNQIKEFCQSLDLARGKKSYELLWHHDEKGITTNKLDRIIEGDYYYCCRDCGSPMTFINKKTAVMYCYFNKSKI